MESLLDLYQYISDIVADMLPLVNSKVNMAARCIQELHAQAKAGNLERVVTLLESDNCLGCLINEKHGQVWLDVLNKAVRNENFNCSDVNRTTLGNYFVTFFDPHETNDQGETILIKLVRIPAHNFLLEEFLKAGVNPNKAGMFCKTAVMHAVESCNHRGFLILCRYGADLHIRDMIGESVAHKLANKLYTNEAVQLYDTFINTVLDTCMENSLNLNAIDNFYSTPLRIAVRNCANGLIIKLLDRGCTVEPTLYTYDTGMTLLHAYITHSDKEDWDPTVFQRLLLCHLDKMDSCMEKHYQGHGTPLVYSIQKRNLKAAQLLLMVNCDANAPWHGQITDTAMYAALKVGYDRFLVSMLLAAGYRMSSMLELACGLNDVDNWYIDKVKKGEQVVEELANLPFNLVPFEHIYVTKTSQELDEIHLLATNPLSLLLQTRIVIRKCLGRGILQPKVDKLPLPCPLKNFIYRVDLCASLPRLI